MSTEARKRTAGGVALAAVVLLASLPGRDALGQARTSSSKLAAKASSPAEVDQSLEAFLDQALRDHPEILAAEAKLRLAQAELTRTRFQITRELIALWNARKSQSETARTLEAKFRDGVCPAEEFIEAKGALTETEAQLSYLLGQMGGAARRPAATAVADSKRLPQGPCVEKVLAVLDEITELDFIETPLEDVVSVIEDYHRTQMTTDPLVADVPVTACIKDVPVAAALQMIEDITPGVRFVVADYGVLATSDTSEAATRYISANEFWREQSGQQEAAGGDASSSMSLRRARFLEQLRQQGGPGGGRPFGSKRDEPRKGPPPSAPPASSARDPSSPPDPAQQDKPQPGKKAKAPSPRDPFAP
jgi:hypothetical protein